MFLFTDNDLHQKCTGNSNEFKTKYLGQNGEIVKIKVVEI